MAAGPSSRDVHCSICFCERKGSGRPRDRERRFQHIVRSLGSGPLRWRWLSVPLDGVCGDAWRGPWHPRMPVCHESAGLRMRRCGSMPWGFNKLPNRLLLPYKVRLNLLPAECDSAERGAEVSLGPTFSLPEFPGDGAFQLFRPRMHLRRLLRNICCVNKFTV